MGFKFSFKKLIPLLNLLDTYTYKTQTKKQCPSFRSLFDKSRGVTYLGYIRLLQGSLGAYEEFLDSNFMTEFFDISVCKITEGKLHFYPSGICFPPLEGMYYEKCTDAKNTFILHIMDPSMALGAGADSESLLSLSFLAPT